MVTLKSITPSATQSIIQGKPTVWNINLVTTPSPLPFGSEAPGYNKPQPYQTPVSPIPQTGSIAVQYTIEGKQAPADFKPEITLQDISNGNEIYTLELVADTYKGVPVGTYVIYSKKPPVGYKMVASSDKITVVSGGTVNAVVGFNKIVEIAITEPSPGQNNTVMLLAGAAAIGFLLMRRRHD